MKRYYDWESVVNMIYDRMESMQLVLIDLGSRMEALELMQASKAPQDTSVWSGDIGGDYRAFCNDYEKQRNKKEANR